MEPFRIESLRLHHIGPFRDLEVTFPVKPKPGLAEIHILTGGNGAGKTTILEALALSFTGDYYDLIHLKRIWSLDSFFRLKNGYQRGTATLFSLNNGRWFPSDDSIWIDQYGDKLNVSNAELVNFGWAGFGYSGYRRTDNTRIVGIKDIEQKPLQGAVSFNRPLSTETFLQWLVNTQANELMAKGRGKSDSSNKYRQVLKTIEQAVSEVIGSDMRFDLPEGGFEARIIIDNKSLNFDQLPDGLKSIVSWLGDLLMRMDRIKWENDTPILERSFLLFLDEIEVHLHPAWQRKVLPMVQKLFPNAQIFVSTHSPFVVGSVDGAWVYQFEKQDGYSTLVKEPTLSEDAYSYEYILEEVFGIKERFGVQIERDLAEFQAIKKSILSNQQADYARLDELAQSLSSQSLELESLIGMELKQLKRLTQ
jgi:predicted ATP-binding protein involved in virulence